MKVVVFDLDETLGYFFELGKFWELLQVYFKEKKKEELSTQQNFYELLDLFPEFIRPNIYSILNFLKHKKEKKECNAVMIYTNNQGPRFWVSLIIQYFHEKMHYSLFDQIISAFKINGKRMELCRTTHDKTMSDFIRCTKLPKNTEICFLDDMFHPKMSVDNVYYIKVNPYVHNLSFHIMIQRFISSDLGKRLCHDLCNDEFKNFAENYLNEFVYVYSEKSKEEYEIDKIVSKKTMLLLQNFFKKTEKKRTQKHNNSKKNKRKTVKSREPRFPCDPS